MSIWERNSRGVLYPGLRHSPQECPICRHQIDLDHEEASAWEDQLKGMREAEQGISPWENHHPDRTLPFPL